jgi:hypothetical protein
MKIIFIDSVLFSLVVLEFELRTWALPQPSVDVFILHFLGKYNSLSYVTFEFVNRFYNLKNNKLVIWEINWVMLQYNHGNTLEVIWIINLLLNLGIQNTFQYHRGVGLRVSSESKGSSTSMWKYSLYWLA